MARADKDLDSEQAQALAEALADNRSVIVLNLWSAPSAASSPAGDLRGSACSRPSEALLRRPAGVGLLTSQ